MQEEDIIEGRDEVERKKLQKGERDAGGGHYRRE